jgi:hypothetical protein
MSKTKAFESDDSNPIVLCKNRMLCSLPEIFAVPRDGGAFNESCYGAKTKISAPNLLLHYNSGELSMDIYKFAEIFILHNSSYTAAEERQTYGARQRIAKRNPGKHGFLARSAKKCALYLLIVN